MNVKDLTQKEIIEIMELLQKDLERLKKQFKINQDKEIEQWQMKMNTFPHMTT